MRLYLVQHGAAKTEAEDPQRGLTDEGRQTVERIAQFLAPLRLALDRIEHSDKLRARQTAEILAARSAAGCSLCPRRPAWSHRRGCRLPFLQIDCQG
jgi:phosphohistidine phosphatase SixA